ncbi:uncharacterized protein I206_106036 [Kwoniella pini CBS 10737]|uniref:Uncharacterized protein n=1 Tax=Kwoniella pini CBS 10737 TaxID=1296096 RepID=A0A1B9I147_9TREE|nr:uncharacterized protein I206_04859 [Kwoniella pini CBS 10737]OCF49171.1 hypothetical protein I206_04859 [Kwoniella pini CBS 10737]
MPTLLDLEDDTIRLVAHYTNKDVYIPLPSYGPYWQNFKSDINGKVSRDLLAFRATCKRIHGLAKLEGLHLDVQSFPKMMKWSTDAPREVEKAVRRLRICMPGSGGCKVITVFSTLTNFLHRFDNLEELVITDSGGCHHSYGFGGESAPREPKLPLYPFLANLRSLAVQVSCPICAQEIPEVLLPAAPKIQHLKSGVISRLPPLTSPIQVPMVFPTPTHPFDAINRIKTEWCKRNRRDELSLKTLHLIYLVPRGLQIEDQLGATTKRTLEILPHLEEFSITRFNDNYETMQSGIKLKGKNVHGHCSFSCEGPFMTGPEAISFEETLGDISFPTRLQTFDPVISISIPLTRPIIGSVASIETTRSAFFGNKQCSNDQQIKETENYEATLKNAMVAAAQILIDNIPSLTSGTFWEKGTERSKKDWNLWSWQKVMINGVSRPVIANKPDIMTKAFVSSHSFNMSRENMVGRTNLGMAMMALDYDVEGLEGEQEGEDNSDGEEDVNVELVDGAFWQIDYSVAP